MDLLLHHLSGCHGEWQMLALLLQERFPFLTVYLSSREKTDE